MSDSRGKADGGSGQPITGASLDLRCRIDGLPVQVDLADISAVGLFVQTATPLSVDSEVSVRLRIDGTSFQARGHVVQSVSPERAASEGRKAGYGLLFTDIEEAERARLRKLVDAALAQLSASSARIQPVIQRPTTSVARSRLPAVPEPAAAPDPAESALLVKLREELRALSGKAPWAVLGISQGSEPAVAKEAYFAASKRYHPHQFSRYKLPEIKQLVTELFIAHKRAFDAMSRAPSPRTPITRTSLQPPPPEASAGRSMSPMTNMVITMPRAATPLPRSAAPVPASLRPPPPSTANKPRTAEAERCVIDALKNIAHSRLDAAEADLNKALSLDAGCQNARIWLLVTQARRCKSRGEQDAARAKYLEVLAIDPKHHEALAGTKKQGNGGK